MTLDDPLLGIDEMRICKTKYEVDSFIAVNIPDINKQLEEMGLTVNSVINIVMDDKGMVLPYRYVVFYRKLILEEVQDEET